MKIENCKIDNSNKIPRILLVDMNSYFASVEQQANPHYRGKPLGVCASVHRTSCLIATSKEAKKLGIKTGTLVYKAQAVCPDIVLVQAEPEKYREVNRQINRIFGDYTHQVETYSVDESFLDFRQSQLNPVEVGAQIKRRIREEVGEWLTCSVGIAPNKFMAKLAADMSAGGGSAFGGENSDNLAIIWQSSLPAIYKTKKLSDLWGISRGWTRRLEKLGITSPLQVLSYPVQNLIAVFGKPGFWLWQRVNGLEEDIIAHNPSALSNALASPLILRGDDTAEEPPLRIRGGEGELRSTRQPKSFGNSWVLNFRTTQKDKLAPVILRLAEKAARRMRAEGFIASGMSLSVLLVDGKYFRQSKKMPFRIETGMEAWEQAMRMWKPWRFSAEVLHIAVGLTYLLRKTEQQALFPDKYLGLTPVLDRINDKYGEFTIRSGLLTKTSEFAPDSIAFGK